MARRRKSDTARFPELVLRISWEGPHHGGYFHIEGCIARQDGNLMYAHQEGGRFRGVRFRAQTGWEELTQPGRTMPMYGFEPDWYDGYSSGLNLDECKAGVVALTEIDRKLEAVRKTAGPVASFGAWVQRLAVAIGVGSVKLPNREWNDEPDTAGRIIDQQIAEWQTQARQRAGLDVA
jgi:hypothetical protein